MLKHKLVQFFSRTTFSTIVPLLNAIHCLCFNNPICALPSPSLPRTQHRFRAAKSFPPRRIWMYVDGCALTLCRTLLSWFTSTSSSPSPANRPARRRRQSAEITRYALMLIGVPKMLGLFANCAGWLAGCLVAAFSFSLMPVPDRKSFTAPEVQCF